MLAELREKSFDWKEQSLPKHPMAEAIKYAVGHWEELNVFLTDGAVAIDNNVSEREMKRLVLNRQNSLFVGNARGGRTAAILASLTSSCRRHDVGHAPVNALAERLDIERTAMGKMVGFLERDGFVMIKPSPTDGRSRLRNSPRKDDACTTRQLLSGPKHRGSSRS